MLFNDTVSERRITERRITERRIIERRISERRITERRITERQKLPNTEYYKTSNITDRVEYYRTSNITECNIKVLGPAKLRWVEIGTKLHGAIALELCRWTFFFLILKGQLLGFRRRCFATTFEPKLVVMWERIDTFVQILCINATFIHPFILQPVSCIFHCTDVCLEM